MGTAIFTKFLPATDCLGARIKATTGCKTASITIPYPYELSGSDCHRLAAEALASKIGANKNMKHADIFNGYVFITL